MLIKRGKIYYCNFSVKGARFRESTFTSNKKDALKIAQKIKSKAILGLHDLNEKEKIEKSLEEIRNDFIQYQTSIQKTESTKLRTKQRFSFFCSFSFGYSLDQLTRKLVEDYIQERQKIVKNATINEELSILKRFFRYCIDHNYLKISPIENLKNLPEEKPDTIIYSEKELRVILRFPDYPKAPKILKLAYLTGFRISDIYRLERKHIDFAKNIISFKMQKTKIQLNFPICKDLEELLKEIFILGYGLVPEKGKLYPLMTERDYKDGVYRYLKRNLRKKGIDGAGKNFHTLRHTFATHSLLKGIDFYKVSKLLGHTKTEMTERYLHLLPTHFKETAQKLNFTSSLSLGEEIKLNR
ncbi:MAG: hypothetical protein DWQ06_03700 [Calditrichaeota bacterium]|nr:MAG: hypothetical protein DWQ06_03700 [Calditrichota bacterium]